MHNSIRKGYFTTITKHFVLKIVKLLKFMNKCIVDTPGFFAMFGTFPVGGHRNTEHHVENPRLSVER